MGSVALRHGERRSPRADEHAVRRAPPGLSRGRARRRLRREPDGAVPPPASARRRRHACGGLERARHAAVSDRLGAGRHRLREPRRVGLVAARDRGARSRPRARHERGAARGAELAARRRRAPVHGERPRGARDAATHDRAVGSAHRAHARGGRGRVRGAPGLGELGPLPLRGRRQALAPRHRGSGARSRADVRGRPGRGRRDHAAGRAAGCAGAARRRRLRPARLGARRRFRRRDGARRPLALRRARQHAPDGRRLRPIRPCCRMRSRSSTRATAAGR